jgi:putative transposase
MWRQSHTVRKPHPYQGQVLACDFFAVETLWLKILYVLFFIEHNTQQVFFAGCTSHPTGIWVTQQARQMMWMLEDLGLGLRLLIHDRDSKFTTAFNMVFRSDRLKVVLTPYRSPNANAIAERWVRTV